MFCFCFSLLFCVTGRFYLGRVLRFDDYTDDAQNELPEVFNDETVENGIYFICLKVFILMFRYVWFFVVYSVYWLLLISYYLRYSFFFRLFVFHFQFHLIWCDFDGASKKMQCLADISLNNGETHDNGVDEVDGPNGNFLEWYFHFSMNNELYANRVKKKSAKIELKNRILIKESEIMVENVHFILCIINGIRSKSKPLLNSSLKLPQ